MVGHSSTARFSGCLQHGRVLCRFRASAPSKPRLRAKALHRQRRARAAAKSTSSAGEAPWTCTGAWRTRCDRRAARARSARTPLGAEREKPAREARFETPLHGRRCSSSGSVAFSVPVPLSRPRQRAPPSPLRRTGERGRRATRARLPCACMGGWRARRSRPLALPARLAGARGLVCPRGKQDTRRIGSVRAPLSEPSRRAAGRGAAAKSTSRSRPLARARESGGRAVTARPLAPGRELRVPRVRPRGAEREKSAREARSETAASRAALPCWQASLSAAPVPCQRYFRSRGARRHRTKSTRSAGEAPVHMHGSLADTAWLGPDRVFGAYTRAALNGRRRRARLDSKRRFTGGAAFVGCEDCARHSASGSVPVLAQPHLRRADRTRARGQRRTARAAPAKPRTRSRESGGRGASAWPLGRRVATACSDRSRASVGRNRMCAGPARCSFPVVLALQFLARLYPVTRPGNSSTSESMPALALVRGGGIFVWHYEDFCTGADIRTDILNAIRKSKTKISARQRDPGSLDYSVVLVHSWITRS